MKKRWIPFIGACIVVSFIAGQLFGANSQAEHQEAFSQAQSVMQTTIAVINSDTGIIVDNERQNFSAAIIDTLGDDFVLVSPAMAHTGLASGQYGAIVTFPANVSERILSFNADSPEQVRLEFQVNPNLLEHDFIETYSRIMDLQMSINTTLAYTYVSSIFGQFHAAQDQIANIFQNDLAHLEALDIVNMEEFTPTLALDELPHIPLDPNEPVTSHFLIGVTDFAQIVSSMYLNSFQAATQDYLEMRTGLIALADNLPHQENEWVEALDSWSDISVRFGEDLQVYSSVVREHQQDLAGWHQRTTTWNDNLFTYEQLLTGWHTSVGQWNAELLAHQTGALGWYTTALLWNENLINFQDALTAWYLTGTGWNTELATFSSDMGDWWNIAFSWHTESAQYQTNLTSWRYELNGWNEQAGEWFDSNQVYLNSLRVFGEAVSDNLLGITSQYNDAISALEVWLDDQLGYITELRNFGEEYNNHLQILELVHSGLAQWHNQLNSYASALEVNAVQLQQAISYFETAMTSLPPEPDITPDPLPPTKPGLPLGDNEPPLPNPETGDGSSNGSGADSGNGTGNETNTTPPPDEPADNNTTGQLSPPNVSQTPEETPELPNDPPNESAGQDTYTYIPEAPEPFGISETHNHFPQPMFPVTRSSQTDVSNWIDEILQWQTGMIAAASSVSGVLSNFNLTVPTLSGDMSVLDNALDLGLWNRNIALPPTIDYFLTDNDFTPPNKDFPNPKDAPPIFIGDTQPTMVDAPQEFAITRPADPPSTQIAQASTPPQFGGSQPSMLYRPAFEGVVRPALLQVYQPIDPLVSAPPRPDDFWSSINYMHSQLLTFDVDSYLTQAYRLEVERMLREYELYLDFIRSDLTAQFGINVDMLHDVRYGYTDFLSHLRFDTMQAEAESMAQLNDVLNTFSQRVGNISTDTRNRLGAFSAMMPESRTPFGLNHDLVRFTVSPFEFISPQMRDSVAAQTDSGSIAETFEFRLWLALPVLGVILVVTLISHVTVRKRREAHAKNSVKQLAETF